MSITDQVHTLARHEYALLRTFAQAVDRRLAPVADNSAGLSNALDRVRDVLRDFDDRMTRKDHPADHPAEPTRDESVPAETPAETPADAPATPAAEEVVSDPAPAPEPVEEDEVEELAEEYLEEETGHLTGELADNEDLRDVQARLRAKHTLQERDEQQH